MHQWILGVDEEPDLEILISQQFHKRSRSEELSFLYAHNGVAAAISKPSILNRSYTAKSG